MNTQRWYNNDFSMFVHVKKIEESSLVRSEVILRAICEKSGVKFTPLSYMH